MKKSTVSVLSLILAGSLCMTTAAWAFKWDHPDGVIKIKVVNESHAVVKLGGYKHVSGKPVFVPGTHTFGPLADVHFMVKENNLATRKLGYMDKGVFVVQYEYDKHIVPTKKYGAHVTLKKAFKKKDGHVFFKRCTVGVVAGPGKPRFGKWGNLCKHVDIYTNKNDSGTTLYLKAKYH